MIASLNHTSTLDSPGLLPYLTLKRPREHFEQGIFIAEGTLVVKRLLISSLTVRSVLLSPEHLREYRSILDERIEPIEVFVAEKKLLEEIVGINYHQCLMAVAAIPPRHSLDTVIGDKPSPRILVALDRLNSAENTGVVIRNAAGFGAHGVIVGDGSADPYLRRAVRNSVGTVFNLPLVYSNRLSTTLEKLRSVHGFRLLAAHPRPESNSLFSADLSGDCCLVFGSEGDGVSREILDICDECMTIPMEDGVDSLNVACASAAILCEAMRQRMVILNGR